MSLNAYAVLLLIPIAPILIGFVLDLLLGDPPEWPHPVRWIGSSINLVQSRIRARAHTEEALRIGGGWLWLIIVVGSWLITFLLLLVARVVSFWLWLMVSSWCAYTVLATKCLRDEAMKVYDRLINGTLEDARRQVSYIVGRDTSDLNQEQIIRAVIETVAENTVDGVIAPLFYLFLGGVPLGMAYKAVNTLDSMVGYQTSKYAAIGMISARIDDVFNWLPARVSWLLFVMAAWLLRMDACRALRVGWRDRFLHKSPNSGWSEATVAGALGIQLGGPSQYFGEVVNKPWIGDSLRQVEAADILRSIRLMYVVAVLALVLFFALYASAVLLLTMSGLVR